MTTDRKPYCVKHVARMPYAQEVITRLQQRDEEVTRLEKGRNIPKDSILGEEILAFLEVHGDSSSGKLARNLIVSKDVIEKLARSLKYYQLIEIYPKRNHYVLSLR